MDIGSPVVLVHLQRDNGLLAVASDDLVLRLFDVESPATTLVRQFSGHTNRISDICFSKDGRWLLSSALDSHVRVWDVPQGRCVDWFAVQKPVTSMSLSPTLDFLATTHVDQNGIFLWANKQQFSHVVLRRLPKSPILADMPTTTGIVDSETSSKPVDKDQSQVDDNVDRLCMKSVNQLSPQLLTFSSVPQSQWLMLSKLDVVKERNKPTAPPAKPQQAPFFLPQSWDSNNISSGPKFVPNQTPQADSKSRELKPHIVASSQTVLCGLLRDIKITDADIVESSSFDVVIETLKQLTPSRVDFELRSLSDDVSGVSLLKALKCFRAALEVRIFCGSLVITSFPLCATAVTPRLRTCASLCR